MGVIFPLSQGPRPGLMIGANKQRAGDVVYNGTITPEWAGVGGQGKEFYSGNRLFDFIFSLNSSLIGDAAETQAFSLYAVSPSSQLKVQPIGVVSGVIKVASFPVSSELMMVCREEGHGRAGVAVQLEHYDDLEVYVQKTCVWPMISVGSTSQQGNFATNSTVKPNNNVVVSTNDDASNFYVWLAPSQSESLNNGQEVVVVCEGDRTYTNCAVSGPSGPIMPQNLGSANKYVVTYNCINYGKEVSVDMKLKFSFGWEENLVIPFTKVCGPHSKPKSSGWSAAGIFFFVVFILTLAFCVFGCGFNYVKHNRTGLDMVPGIELYRSLYRRMFGVRAYTPQSDYDEAYQTSAAANYQTDL